VAHVPDGPHLLAARQCKAGETSLALDQHAKHRSHCFRPMPLQVALFRLVSTANRGMAGAVAACVWNVYLSNRVNKQLPASAERLDLAKSGSTTTKIGRGMSGSM
jgi:hypothetical protein